MKKNYRRGDIGRFLATRTKKLAETTNPVKTEISEPTVEQIKAWLRSLPGSMSAWSKRDEAMREAIRRLIENMDKKPKLNRGAWNKWTARIKDDYNLGPMHIIYLVKEMLIELDHEVEEKEGGGE